MKYEQMITDPNMVANVLNTLTEEGNKICYVLPFHQFDGALVVIVYDEAKDE